MLVITRIVLADTSTPTPLIADCNNDGLYKTAPCCSDTFPAPFTSLSRPFGCTPGLCLLVCFHRYVWQIKCPTAKAVCTIWVVRVRTWGVDRVGVLPNRGRAVVGCDGWDGVVRSAGVYAPTLRRLLVAAKASGLMYV